MKNLYERLTTEAKEKLDAFSIVNPAGHDLLKSSLIKNFYYIDLSYLTLSSMANAEMIEDYKIYNVWRCFNDN